jgi:GNAT superfamily N-acetyltransferase
VFASERLQVDHAVELFDCGRPPLNRWLQQSAFEQAERKLANTRVWVEGNAQVLAYFTLIGHTVARESVPSRLGRGGPDVIPAILIAKLALDRSLQNQKLGADLLIDALSRCAAADDAGPGFKLVVVDAKDGDAGSFYERFGFRPIQQGSLTLYRKMADIIDDLYGQ